MKIKNLKNIKYLPFNSLAIAKKYKSDQVSGITMSKMIKSGLCLSICSNAALVI
ncbi:hypothetical protein [Okeania sp. SIO2B3]|uniref:hypothetical protein n=1 Tax=Okeania sp. SIO2B3 TaxID=2607784 RepID=UPI0025E05135|nr:hypothetical protein [Okeania sp. SIO2B3]